MPTASKKRKSAKFKSTGGVCLYSGKKTAKPTSRFLPGNDARLKSLLIKVLAGKASLSSVPDRAQDILRSREGLLGFRIRKGKLSRNPV